MLRDTGRQMQTSSNYIKGRKFQYFTNILGPLIHLFIRPIILIFNLKRRKNKGNNACSMQYFISLKQYKRCCKDV